MLSHAVVFVTRYYIYYIEAKITQAFLKILIKTFYNFSRYFGKSQTDKQQLSHNLSGRGNNKNCLHKIHFASIKVTNYRTARSEVTWTSTQLAGKVN